MTGKNPRNKNFRGGLHLTDYLYNKAKLYEEKTELKKIREQERLNKRKILPSSDYIVENMKKNRLSEIFHLLDSDNDG